MAEPPTKACPSCGALLEDWAQVCPKCLYEWPSGDEPLSAVAAFEAGLERNGPTPWAVHVLLGLNLLVFVAMAIAGANLWLPDSETLFRWGGNYPPATLGGQWWRLPASMFIHAGILHLGFNLYILWLAGRKMERILGHTSFDITYLFAGLAGTLASTAIHGNSVSIGASGAIFGIYGALLGYLVRDRDALPRSVYVGLGKSTLIFLVYNVIFALRIKNIDLSAHGGGLLGGFLAGLILAKPFGDGRHWNFQKAAVAVGGLATIVVLAWALARNAALTLDGFPLGSLADRTREVVQERIKENRDTHDAVVEKVTFERHSGLDHFGTVTIRWHDREEQLPIEVHLEQGTLRWKISVRPGG